MADIFPFLFGRAFIEARFGLIVQSSGLAAFPFLFGRAFIEAFRYSNEASITDGFPFLFGRAFIEAIHNLHDRHARVGISLPFWKGFH